MWVTLGRATNGGAHCGVFGDATTAAVGDDIALSGRADVVLPVRRPARSRGRSGPRGPTKRGA